MIKETNIFGTGVSTVGRGVPESTSPEELFNKGVSDLDNNEMFVLSHMALVLMDIDELYCIKKTLDNKLVNPITKFREMMGLSIQDFSYMADIPQSSLYSIESRKSGFQNMKCETIGKICNVLNLKFEHLGHALSQYENDIRDIEDMLTTGELPSNLTYRLNSLPELIEACNKTKCSKDGYLIIEEFKSLYMKTQRLLKEKSVLMEQHI